MFKGQQKKNRCQSQFFREAAPKWLLGGERAASSRTDLGTELVVSSPAWKH